MQIRFVDKAIQALKSEDKRYEVAARGEAGFRLRVAPSGVKTFVYRYKISGRVRVVTLGNYPTTTLAAARRKYLTEQALVKDDGKDVAVMRQDKRRIDAAEPTVVDLVDEYIERWAKREKRSWREDERILNRELVPALGHLKGSDVQRRHIVTLLDRIVDRGSPVQANRTLAAIRKCFNFAVQRGRLESSPCFQVKAPAGEESRDRVLSYDEIRQLWDRLPDCNMARVIELSLKFHLLTAQRKGEVIAARWDDIEDDVWTIPKERSKNGRAHRVPLGKLALEIVAEAGELSGEPWVFPSPKVTDQPLSATSINRALRLNCDMIGIADFTPHDLRRTAATRLTELGIPRVPHVEQLLNHADRSVGAIYDRNTYEPEKRKAIDVWDRRLRQELGLETSAKVVKLSR